MSFPIGVNVFTREPVIQNIVLHIPISQVYYLEMGYICYVINETKNWISLEVCQTIFLVGVPWSFLFLRFFLQIFLSFLSLNNNKNLTDNSPTYLQESESHFVYIPLKSYSRLYNTTLLQTNAAHGFRIAFHLFYLADGTGTVQIGTGNDPSDNQSVIATIHGCRDYADEFYIGTNEMWFTVIGAKVPTCIRMRVEFMSIDLSSEYVIILDLSYLNIIYIYQSSSMAFSHLLKSLVMEKG